MQPLVHSHSCAADHWISHHLEEVDQVTSRILFFQLLDTVPSDPQPNLLGI